MSNQTLYVTVHSSASQRFDPVWRSILESVLSDGGAAVVDVGGGTDMSAARSENEYEITGPDDILQRSISGLRLREYSFRVEDSSGYLMTSSGDLK